MSELAHLELEVYEERNPANPESKVAEATLYLKGATLRARSASRDLRNAVIDVSDEIAVQVKRHLDKRRGYREARAGAAVPPPLPETDVAPVPGDISPAA